MENQQENEEWRVIAEFPNYEVSNLGRVRSWAPQHHLMAKPTEPSLMTIQRSISGYEMVALTFGGKTKGRSIHRLVASAFCVRISPEKNLVRHMDGNPSNNRATNLKWGTSRENREDQFRHGNAPFGERATRSKLTDIQASEIFYDGDSTCSELAAKFGVTTATISRIRTGKTRKRSGHEGKSPGAVGVGGRSCPMKINADQAKEIFLSTDRHVDLAAKYQLSVPTIHYIQSRKRWRRATDGLIAPDRPRRPHGPWKAGRISPLKYVSEETVRGIFMSPLNGRDAAKKFKVTEGFVSSIRSGKTCMDYTKDLIAPFREKPIRLDIDKARQIFQMEGSLREVAAKFDISFNMVSLIRRRLSWAHATKDLPSRDAGS